MSDVSTSLPIRTENPGDVVIKLGDKTTPTQQLAIDASGNASVTVSNASIVVTQATAANLKVTANNNDGVGNALTSSAAGSTRPLDTALRDAAGVLLDPRVIRALTSSDVVTSAQGTAAAITSAWPTKLTDGTNTASLTAAGEIKTSITQPIPAGTNSIGTVVLTAGSVVTANIKDSSGTALGLANPLSTQTVVSGAAVDPRAVRALTSADVVSANLRDSTGTAFSVSNPLPVYLQSTSAGTQINDYTVATAVAAAATSNHDYTVTTGKTLRMAQIVASASGKIKIEVQLETAAASGVFVSKFVAFNSTANPTIVFPLSECANQIAGARVRIIRTNKDLQAQDLYSTISGTEA